MPTLTSLVQAQRQNQQPTPAAPQSEPAVDPNAASADQSIDTNGDGIITAEELFSYFDTDGDGQMTMTDFAAHMLYHIYNPGILKPYMTEAKKTMDLNKEKYAKLSSRLAETTIISKADPTATDKARQALQTGDDIKVVDKDKINQFKIMKEAVERGKFLAGI